jgi:hypothetical protein
VNRDQRHKDDKDRKSAIFHEWSGGSLQIKNCRERQQEDSL